MKKRIRFQNFSIFTKISLVTVMVVLLISVASTGLIISRLSRNILDKDRLLVREATSKINTFFQDSYNTMYNQRTLLHSTGYIADSIATTRSDPSSIYDPQHLTKITDYMNALAYTNSKIEEIMLFTADGENKFSYSNKSGRKIYLGYDFTELSYIKDFSKSTDVTYAIYDPDPAYLSFSSANTEGNVITFITKIVDMSHPAKQNLLGYLMINFAPSSVDSAYSEITEASDGDYLVLNSQSTVIYSNNPKRINKQFSSEWAPEHDIVFDKTISLSGLRIVGSVSDAKLRQKTNSVIHQSFFVTGCGIVLIIIVIMLLHHHYSKKFHQLATAMGSISGGDFSLQLPVNSEDEIGYLSRTFNTMSSTLDEYISRHYLAETQRRTAELYALQAQINPHFLANTIESIRMRALENDDYEASEMLKKFGNLFRWMVQFNQDIIYIEDELEYIGSYLDLQKFRFPDRLFVDIDLPSDIYYYGIPRFTLQPIIENVLSHGVPTVKPLEIHIRFTVKNGELSITVRDNGPGMNEAELGNLNTHIHGEKTFPQYGVALRNIHSRIQLLFGEAYCLQVKSVYCQGTTVTVTLPARPKKELEEYVQTTHSG